MSPPMVYRYLPVPISAVLSMTLFCSCTSSIQSLNRQWEQYRLDGEFEIKSRNLARAENYLKASLDAIGNSPNCELRALISLNDLARVKLMANEFRQAEKYSLSGINEWQKLKRRFNELSQMNKLLAQDECLQSYMLLSSSFAGQQKFESSAITLEKALLLCDTYSKAGLMTGSKAGSKISSKADTFNSINKVRILKELGLAKQKLDKEADADQAFKQAFSAAKSAGLPAAIRQELELAYKNILSERGLSLSQIDRILAASSGETQARGYHYRLWLKSYNKAHEMLNSMSWNESRIEANRCLKIAVSLENDRMPEARTIELIGKSFSYQGDFANARKNLDRSCKLVDLARGKDSGEALWAVTSALEPYWEEKRLFEARELINRKLALTGKLYSRDNQKFTECLILQGELAREMSDFNKAHEYLQEAQNRLERFKGKGTETQAVAIFMLAQVYSRMNELEKAERLLAEARSSWERSGKYRDPYALRTEFLYAYCLEKTGHKNEALAVIKQASKQIPEPARKDFFFAEKAFQS